MVLFWILASLMVAIALAFVLVPLLRHRASRAPSETEANLAVLRGQRQEIDADIGAGVLPADARDEALADLVGRAADDLSPADAAGDVAAPKPWVTAAIAAAAIPALAFGLYLAIGNPGASDMAKPLAVAEPVAGEKQIVAMVESLASKVKERPDDAKGWALLARSMAALGRFKEAADAYERLSTLMPGNADVLADQADALGMVQGQRLDGPPLALVKKALAIDPRHKKALALAGTAAMDAGDLAAATGYWQSLAAELPAGSEDEQQVKGILAEIRQRSGPAQAPAARTAQGPAAAAPQAQAAAQAPAATIQSVSGSIAVAPAIAAQISGTETVFIFARAERGPRVPLALVRVSARELPMKFALSDKHAMAPGVNLSSADAVRIEARISRSGNATPQPGDLVGTSAVVAPGARDVAVVVNRVLP